MSTLDRAVAAYAKAILDEEYAAANMGPADVAVAQRRLALCEERLKALKLSWNTKFYVELGAVGNTDYGHRDRLRHAFVRKTRVPVDSLAEASRVTQDFIREHELGGGNWTGGDVMDEKGRFVAYVSYNGRIWDSKGPDAKEL